MVDIARCRECGNKMSQVWGVRGKCIECGGPVEQIKVDMGAMDKVPRYLNMGGIAFTLFAVLYLIYQLARDEMGRSQGTTVIVLFLVGIIFFTISLLVQLQLASRAKEQMVEELASRRLRRLRPRERDEGSNIRSGRVEPLPRRTASKVLVKRR